MTVSLFTSQFSLSPSLYPGYRLRRLRGRGGFGEVWEAETDSGALVALKFLSLARGAGASQEVRSIQMVRELSHPHLTRVDRVWCAPGFLIIAMELADGSLTDLLEVYRTDLHTPIPPDHLTPLLTQAARALDFLNTQQHLAQGQWVTIQHLDVTPSNLLLFGNTVKLSDFGLTTTLAGREKTHYRAGTPAYAAAEVFQGRISDRSDQYALAVCYCLLRGGRQPFPDTPAMFAPGYTRPLPDLTMVSAEEQPILARALSPVPQDRWPSSGELVAELARVTATSRPPAAFVERRADARHRPAAGVACEVLATMGNAAWQATVQNISAGGVRLRISRPGCALRPGRVLELILYNTAHNLRVPIRLRLTHARETAGGDYEVGGPFNTPLTPGELTVLSDTRSP